MAVLHERVHTKGKPGFLARPFAHQLGLWVGLAFMRLIATLLSLEVDRWIAAIIVFRLGTLPFGLKAFQTRPGFNERAVDGEMFVTDPTVAASQFYHRTKE